MNELTKNKITPLVRSRRYPGIDGIKGFAIIAIVIYHIFPNVLPGGFLGVDVFLAVSGFGIAVSLIRSMKRDNTIGFADYMKRRLKRVMPALLLMIAVIVITAAFINRDFLVRAYQQVLAASTCTYNWFSIFSNANYFDIMNPKLFNHLWYVGILMQCYIAAPLLIYILRKIRKPKVAEGILVGLAALSLISMAVMFDASNPTRVYEGTDTHCGAFLLGMALAWRCESRPKSKPILHNAAAPVCFGALVLLMFVTDGASAFTYRGGIILSTVISVLLLDFTVKKEAFTYSVFEWIPLKKIGTLSYGIYLWHWPLWLLFSRGMTGSPTAVVFIIAMLATAAAALLSNKYIEKPGQPSSAKEPAKKLSLSELRHSKKGIACAVLSIVCVIVLITAPLQTEVEAQLGRIAAEREQETVQSGSDSGDETSDEISAESGIAQDTEVSSEANSESSENLSGESSETEQGAEQSAAQDAEISETPEANESAAQSTEQSTDASSAEETQTEAVQTAISYPTGAEMCAVGDSVMRMSSSEIEAMFPEIYIDAEGYRNWDQGIEIIQGMRERGELRKYLIVGLASNSFLDETSMDQLRAAAGDDVIVAVMGAHGPSDVYPRYPAMNEMLRAYAQAHSENTIFIDWDAAASAHLDLFYSDGVHPVVGAGGQLYAQTISDALNAWVDAQG